MPPQTIELRAEPRTVFGKSVRRLRRQGLVPANIFGHGDSRAIQAPLRALDLLIAHGGRGGLVSIALDGGAQTALLKEIQRDPRSGAIIHVDFQAVSLEESVTSTVPLRFVGAAPAVAREGGVLTHPLTEVRVAARAADLPEAIEVDLSSLDAVHAAIHVSDLAPSAVYRLLEPPEQVLAVVLPQKGEAVEAEAGEAAASGEGGAAGA